MSRARMAELMEKINCALAWCWFVVFPLFFALPSRAGCVGVSAPRGKFFLSFPVYFHRLQKKKRKKKLSRVFLEGEAEKVYSHARTTHAHKLPSRRGRGLDEEAQGGGPKS